VIFLLSNQLTPSLFNIARACGGLECKIGKFVHIYDDAEEALTSFSMKGQPLPQRYFEKMKHNQMKKIVTFYPLPVGAAEGDKDYVFLEEIPIENTADVEELDCTKKAILKIVTILGSPLGQKLDDLKAALILINPDVKDYQRIYLETIGRILKLDYKKQYEFNISNPFHGKEVDFFIGFLNRHAYGVIKKKVNEKVTCMIVDTAEPDALAMNEENLNKAANGKFVKFDKVFAFTKRAATTKGKKKGKRKKKAKGCGKTNEKPKGTSNEVVDLVAAQEEAPNKDIVCAHIKDTSDEEEDPLLAQYYQFKSEIEKWLPPRSPEQEIYSLVQDETMTPEPPTTRRNEIMRKNDAQDTFVRDYPPYCP